MLVRYALFMSVGTSLVFSWHYYLYIRLVRDAELPPMLRTGATILLVLLALVLPLSMMLTRALGHGMSRPFFYAAYGWMGLAFLLFFSLLVGDVVKVFVELGTRLAGDPLDDDRRRLLARMVAGIASTVGLGAGGLGVISALNPIVERVTVPLKRLPAALSGLRIVQLSDVHVGPTIGREHIERIVAQVNELSPDVVAITGDLVDGSVDALREHVEPLSRIKAKHGVFFVTGNHEYYSGALEWVAHLRSLGIKVLRNERVTIGSGDDLLDIAGVDDFNAHGLAPGHGHDPDRALAGLSPDREVVLLAHQPRSVFDAARHGVGLQLSGHTHGGQIFPWRFFVKLQQPFVAGLDRVRDTLVYTSKGTGYWGPPMRVGASAEVTELTLVRA